MIKLKDNNGKSYLVDECLEIGRGGEGRIIPIKGGKVVKLYFDPSKAISQHKIDELSTLDGSLFLKPETVVSGDANGFIMPELNTNDYFPLYSIFSSNFATKRNLPTDYKKIIAKRLVEAVKIAHKNGIVIGDLNPFNIMVNNSLDIKFIDVDSYQTRSYKHNDKMLEDIRDYVYNGVACESSDCFSLAVIIFYLFTYIHPYKGVHNVYGNSIKDRMINDCSIISKESCNIKIPKFYQPITDKELLSSFARIFNNRERFIIDLDNAMIKNISFDGVIMGDNLIITDILSEPIIKVTSSKNYICVITKKHTIIFQTPTKGVITNLITVENDVDVILTDKNIFGFKNGEFKLLNLQTLAFDAIKDVKINNIHCMNQYDNILIVITKNDEIYKLYLDEVYNNYIKYTITNVYHKSLHKNEGLYQHIGTHDAIFYHNGKDISMLTIQDGHVFDISQVGNVGILSSWKDNNKAKLTHELFTINKYGALKSVQLPDLCQFSANDNFIVLYYDNMLRFINKETLIEMVSFKADGLDDYAITMSNIGIVIYNDNHVKFLNSK